MIRVRLDYVLLDRSMTLSELAEKTGIALNNLSILKTNKARAIRFSTLNAVCKALDCSPGALLEYVPDDEDKPLTDAKDCV
ncbi:MAG: helix-turn-helix transcriptional regulator [Candidatus Hydrogenedentales bacterium]